MKILKPLSSILDNKCKVKILRLLVLRRSELSGRQIAREIKFNPVTCHRFLRELVEQGVLIMRRGGNAHLFSLNQNNYLISKLLIPLFQQEDKILEEVFKGLVKGLKKEVVSIILYGSLVSGEEKSHSDIDVLIVVKKDSDKRRVDKLIDTESNKIILQFGRVISPLLMTIQEFNLKYRKRNALAVEIVKTGRVIYGKTMSEVLAYGG